MLQRALPLDDVVRVLLKHGVRHVVEGTVLRIFYKAGPEVIVISDGLVKARTAIRIAKKAGFQSRDFWNSEGVSMGELAAAEEVVDELDQIVIPEPDPN